MIPKIYLPFLCNKREHKQIQQTTTRQMDKCPLEINLSRQCY